ncbi:MAG: Fic family protein [Acidobacteria bacterium]|nr:Fic family protein [Acidobacteriota bacterium]
MVFTTPTLTDIEVRVHEKIDQLREKLSYSVSSRKWIGLLSRVSRAKAIQGSNSIEGYNVTVEDALAAVDGEEPPDASSETWTALVGYRNAMTYVLQLADDRHFGYSPDLIRSLHYMMANYDLAKHPGRWRPGPIFVQNEATGERVYEGPDVELVPGLIDELMTELNSANSHPVMVRAAMAHLNLVMIHPFSDGNGRMARCLQSLVLAREGILAPEFSSIEEYLGRNQREYYDVLADIGQGRWHPARDATNWVRFCLTAHYRQAVTVLRRSREFGRMCSAVDELLAQFKLPARTFYALADTTQGFRLVNSRYRAIAEISQNLASRDLAQLCQLGLVEAHGERRGRFYTASAITKDIRAKTREPRVPIPDPFDAPADDDVSVSARGRFA